jgi:hypothetical protein
MDMAKEKVKKTEVKAEKVEAKPEPPKRPPAADKRLKMVTARHKQLPNDLVERMRKCDSAGQIKRLLKAHLQSAAIKAAVK